jgi:transposase-like protein
MRRLKMDVPPTGKQRKKHADRPGPCPVCGRAAWWNGTRLIKRVVFVLAAALRWAEQFVRRRARCSDRRCSAGSWTVYERGGYPCRTFLLSVVAFAAAAMAVRPEVTLTSVARECGCDRRSVGRWVDWVAGLAAPAELSRACARLDPDGLPSPAAPRSADAEARAGAVVGLLDRLTDLLRGRGVVLESGPGLAAILRHQLDRFRIVFHLTRQSPPLHADEGAVFG